MDDSEMKLIGGPRDMGVTDRPDSRFVEVPEGSRHNRRMHVYEVRGRYAVYLGLKSEGVKE